MGHADTSDIHLGFEFRRKVEPVNWRKIASVDIDRICHELDFQTLQDNVTHVTFCNIETEVDTNTLDPSFIKLFRLAQLIIEYLLSTQEYLTNNVETLEKMNEGLDKEVTKLREELKEKEKLVKELKKENKKRRRMIEDNQRELGITSTKTVLFQCAQCPKTFVSPFYLQNHVQRRHYVINESHNKTTDVSQQSQPEKPLKDDHPQGHGDKFEMVKMFEEWKKLISLEREEQKHQILSANEKLLNELQFLKKRQEEAEKELSELRMKETLNERVSRQEEELRMRRESSFQIEDQQRRNSMDLLHLQLENQHKQEIEQLKLLLKQQEESFREELKKSVQELKQLKKEESKVDGKHNGRKGSVTTTATIDDGMKTIRRPPRRSFSEDEIRKTTESSKNEILRIAERSQRTPVTVPKKPVEVVKVIPAVAPETSSSGSGTESESGEESQRESEPSTPTRKRYQDEEPVTSTPIKSPPKSNKPSPSVIRGLKDELNSLVDERLNSYKNKVGRHSDLEKSLKLLEKDRSKKSSKIPNFGQLREKWRSLVSKKATIGSPERTNVPAVRLVMMKNEPIRSPVLSIGSPIRKKESPRRLKPKNPVITRAASPTEKTASLPEYRPTTSSMKNLKEKAKSDGAIPVKKLSFTEPEVRILNMTESSEEDEAESSEQDSIEDIPEKQTPVITPRSPVRSKPIEKSKVVSPKRTPIVVHASPVRSIPVVKPKSTMYQEADSESLEELESVSSESSWEEDEQPKVIKVRPPTSYKVAQLASSIEQQLANRSKPSTSTDEPTLENKRRLAGSVDTLAPLRSSLNTSTPKDSTLSVSDDRGFYGSLSTISKVGSKQSMEDSESVSSLEKLMQEIVSSDGKSASKEPKSSHGKSVGNYGNRRTKESSWDSELDLA